jgi:hypothetical protein
MIAVARPRLVDSADDEPIHDPRILLVVIGEATRKLHRMGLDPVVADEWAIPEVVATLAAEISQAFHDFPVRTVGVGTLEAVRDHVRALRQAFEAGRAAR